ncbi:MAG: DUF6240 domain-containing protein [Catonella sp.]|uniref:DUF6240 domain-containing protein n=1 Tax=Catonella sp. TaxID=2382125 RepID=UPI003F9F8EBB
MQINGLKDKVKILELGLHEKEGIQEKETVGNKISIGEEFNKNIRTKVISYGDATGKLKEEDRELQNFKEKAKKAVYDIEYSTKAMTPDVMKQMEEEGVSASDSDANLVKKSIENIVANRKIDKENLLKQTEKLDEDAEKIKEISYSSVEDARIAKQLASSGMAVTRENIDKLSESLKFTKEIVNNITESAIGYMIEENLPETVSNIYKAEHIMGYVENYEQSKEWEKVENQVIAFLEKKGINADEENLEAASWLFNKKMEITSENIAKYLSLCELKDENESLKGDDKLTERLVKGLVEGKEVLNAVIGTANNKQADYVMNYFRRTADVTITEISQRRYLEEIRLKLTEESAVNMLNKGIKIDVTDLKGLVEQLRKEEKSYYEALLEGAKTLDGDEQVKYMHKVKAESRELLEVDNAQLELLRNVVSIRSYALNKQYESEYKIGALSKAYKEEITLTAYHEAGIAYEKGETKIRTDLGDGISKAFGNIDEVLKENKLELTEANRKAVKLLAYNKAEVSYEAVTKMKFVISLTESALRELKPTTVAGLIKSGLNPLDLSMEELFEAAKEMNEKIVGNDENYSRYLYKLEKAGEVSEPEREAYIGIYRLLNQIEKGDDAAIGSVSLANQSLTLRNMLSAVRTRKLGGFDEKIDESFGELTKILGDGSKIDSQIDRAYMKMLAGNIKESLSETDHSYYEEKLAEVTKEFKTTDVEKILDERAEMTVTNILAQMDISKGRRSLIGIVSEMSREEKRKVNNLSAKFIDEFDSDRFAAENEKAVTDALSKKVTKLMEDEKLTYEKLNGLVAVKKTIELSVKRVESKTYDIPFIYDEDKLADLSITIRKGRAEADKGKAVIILTTNEGSVTSEFRIVNERITGYFKTDSRESLDELKFNEQMLKKNLAAINMEVGEISYHLGGGTSQITNSDDIYYDSVKTSDIYKTAKAVTAYVLKALKIRD